MDQAYFGLLAKQQHGGLVWVTILTLQLQVVLFCVCVYNALSYLSVIVGGPHNVPLWSNSCFMHLLVYPPHKRQCGQQVERSFH